MTSRILNRFNIETDKLLRSLATDIHPRNMIKMVRRVSRDHTIITVERLYYGHPWDWPLVAVIEAWP